MNIWLFLWWIRKTTNRIPKFISVTWNIVETTVSARRFAVLSTFCKFSIQLELSSPIENGNDLKLFSSMNETKTDIVYFSFYLWNEDSVSINTVLHFINGLQYLHGYPNSIIWTFRRIRAFKDEGTMVPIFSDHLWCSWLPLLTIFK